MDVYLHHVHEKVKKWTCNLIKKNVRQKKTL